MKTDYQAMEETAVRSVIENWAGAVRKKDRPRILANHSADIVMFDVPAPLQSRGIDAYNRTWDLFYSTQSDPIAFDIRQLEIVAGDDVAFAFALMQCEETNPQGDLIKLDFRLTIGLRKLENRWVIVHEHHSVPAI